MLLNQNVTHEILPAGAEDIAVNFIILPEFFTHAVRMLESGSILYNFIISAMSSEQGVSSFLHFRVKDALPVQNIIENMIWTLLHKSEVPRNNPSDFHGAALFKSCQFCRCHRQPK